MELDSSSTLGLPSAGPSRDAGPTLAGERGAPAPRSFLPEFADERNRALDREIRALEAELGRTQASLEENEEHSRVLAEHLDSVRLEIRHTQARLSARTREVESESHLRELAARESGRLRSDIARLGVRRGEAAQRVTGLQTEVFKAGEKLAQFKLVQNWNQEELEQWAAAARQKEEDSLALERYRRQDEARVKELGMQLERATREAHQGKRDLEEELTATQAAQAELGKAAQDFRRLHEERQELLGQWEGVLKAISKRDAAILEAGQQVAERKASLAMLQAELKAQGAELDGEVAAGRAAQKRILQQERGIKALYDAYGSAQTGVAEAQDQLDVMSNTLGRAADDVQRQVAAAGHLRAELEQRTAAAAAAQERMEATRLRLQLEGQQLGSLQHKIRELEGLRAEEQRKAEGLERELAALAKQQFRSGQALHAAQEAARRLGSDISGARAQGRNLSHRMAQLEEQLVHQQEVRYNADFQLLQMERRVARAEGHRSRDETAALTARIAELEQALGAAAAEHGMLAEEVKRAEEDYARAKRQSLSAQQERGSILDDMARLEVESGAVARAARAAGREREERLVEVVVLKLEVRRLRVLLSSKSGEVVGLETRKRSLEAGMAERRSEVEMQLELMQNEARLLRDEVRRLTLELNSRRQALEKLQRKRETLLLKGRGQDGEETHSQAYYIIKAAQERQELSEQAEELRKRIAQTEKECRALEGTLRRLVGTNSEMHWHARNAGAQDLVDEQAALRQQLEQATQQLKTKQAEEAATAAALEQARARLESAAAEEAGMRQRLEALQKQKAELRQQVQEQQERRHRAAQRAARLLRQLQAKGPQGALQLLGGLSLEGLLADVQLGQVKEATKGMLEALRALAAEHPEFDLAQRMEAAAGVKLGAAGACEALTSRPGSAARSLCGGGTVVAGSGNSAQASARLGSPAGSRPGSGRCITPGRAGAAAAAANSRPGSSRPGSCAGASARSLGSARGSAPTKSPAVQTMQLQL
ncbi:hypothetical protein ABPG75_011121 [Micractinium tetrahymenae]